MDKINAMNTFVHIVEKGSLTQAAKAINTSLPTVVRVLAALEHSLGVRLINRTTRRIALTEEGQHYFLRCRQILNDIDDAEHTVTAQQLEPRGKLIVSAPLLFGQMHVAPVVTQFLNDNQKTQVELVLLDTVINLIEEGIDVSIRIGHLSDSSLIAIPVGSISQIVCASPKYLEQVGGIVEPKQLKDHNCIHLTAINAALNWPFKIDNKISQVPISSSFQCNQAVVTLNACVDGVGFGMFLCYQVQSLIKSKQLVRVLESFEPESIPVNIIYPHAKLLSTRVRMFIESLTMQLRTTLNYS